ncbi:MAG TPA: DUF6580 family putative transport protein [Bacteroidota bacterium]
MSRFVSVLVLVFAAAFSRLLPHPANLTPVTAIALFGAMYLDRRSAFLVPIAAMLLSDAVLGFHSGMIWVYGSFVAITCIGFWLRDHRGLMQTIGATVAGSVLFFVVTNFGAWLGELALYPRTAAGLAECYVAAIPFFRNTLLGDLGYVALLFGAFELARRWIPSLNQEPATIAH